VVQYKYVGGAVQICGWCSTNMWVVQYKYVGGAVQISRKNPS